MCVCCVWGVTHRSKLVRRIRLYWSHWGGHLLERGRVNLYEDNDYINTPRLYRTDHVEASSFLQYTENTVYTKNTTHILKGVKQMYSTLIKHLPVGRIIGTCIIGGWPGACPIGGWPGTCIIGGWPGTCIIGGWPGTGGTMG